MSSICMSMSFFSAAFGVSVFASLDSILRAEEWDVIGNKEKVIFWGGIRDTGFKISVFTLISSIALNSIYDNHFQWFHLH